MSPRSPRRSIAITSTLRLAPSTPVSTRRKTHPVLDPQPAKNSAGHTLITTAPPIARQSHRGVPPYPDQLQSTGQWLSKLQIDCRQRHVTVADLPVVIVEEDYFRPEGQAL